MLAKLALGFLVLTAVGTAYAVQDGFVHINVDEARNGGTHLHLVLPASLGIVAAHLAPQRELYRGPAELRKILPALKLAASELTKLPDTVLVEVRDRDEHVLISKVGNGIAVDEDSPREHVHVWIPLRAVYDTADVLKTRISGN